MDISLKSERLSSARLRGSSFATRYHRNREGRLHEPPCILVVEDHDDIRRMMKLVLERDGYDVRTAADASTALDLLGSAQPDVLVLDLMMPIVSGWDLLRVRAADAKLRNIPTIVVTAAGELAELDAWQYGVFAVLRKPFEPATLQSLTASALRSSPRHREPPV